MAPSIDLMLASVRVGRILRRLSPSAVLNNSIAARSKKVGHAHTRGKLASLVARRGLASSLASAVAARSVLSVGRIGIRRVRRNFLVGTGIVSVRGPP